MKTNCEQVLFTDESRATLDGPDDWMSGWLLNGETPQSKNRRRKGGRGGGWSVIIWAGIIKDAIVGPFAVPDGVKMNAQSYAEFLKKNFLPWYKKQRLPLKRKMIFLHDNAPSHAARYTCDALSKFGFRNGRVMLWPACLPDLNPIQIFGRNSRVKFMKEGGNFHQKRIFWKKFKPMQQA